VSGTAAGIARRLAVDPVFVRVAFVVLTAAAGVGLAAYLIAWGVSGQPIESAAPSPAAPRPNLRRASAVMLQVLGVLLALREAGVWLGDAFVWPVALAGLGSAVIWARGDERDRAWFASAVARLPSTPLDSALRGRVGVVRALAGAALVVAGGATLLIANADLAAAGSVVLAMTVTGTGLGLVCGPGLAALVRQLSDERRARIRSEERAEMAAHLHDSVLHTLALMQRTTDLVEVAGLARSQERELRAWLHGRTPGAADERLADAFDAVAGRVERQHGVAVESVVVGDLPLDDALRAFVSAAAEAVVNAAKHSGCETVSSYVEVEPDVVVAYVRDDGRGFDLAGVPADRRGIAHSIRGRMERYGGTAEIETAPGEGTEVTLRLPRRVREAQR